MTNQPASLVLQKRFLHVGCGPARKDHTTRVFAGDDWQEVRFDIAESARPDIIGTMTDMSAVASGAFDALYSSHNIEHVYAHEVPVALGEFRRVLNPDGYAVITCPDLQSVAALIAQDKLVEPAYQSPAGPIAPLDILYGYRPELAAGNHYMAHKCGFTRSVLHATLYAAGFASVATAARSAPFFDLWALAAVRPMTNDELGALALTQFPPING